jgi:hypothetical protein
MYTVIELEERQVVRGFLPAHAQMPIVSIDELAAAL